MTYKNLDISVFHYVTIHAFDRQMDRLTEGQSDRRTALITRQRLHSMQPLQRGTKRTFGMMFIG